MPYEIYLPAHPSTEAMVMLAHGFMRDLPLREPLRSPCEGICGSVEPREASGVLLDTVRILATAWILEGTLNDPLAGSVLETAGEGRFSWQGRILRLPH